MPRLQHFFHLQMRPEVVFRDGVQQRLRFCLDRLSCVKVAGNREKSQEVKISE
jgi:hypothetical protein